jgi:transcription initiation factor TFIIIB Brf1 subunit/transcription initiation factor TFIIB
MSEKVDLERAREVVRSIGIDEDLFTNTWKYFDKNKKAQTFAERRLAVCAACALFAARYCGLPVSTKEICRAFNDEFLCGTHTLAMRAREVLRVHRKILKIYKGPPLPQGLYLRIRWAGYIGAKLALPPEIIEDAGEILRSNSDYAQGKNPGFIAGAAIGLACLRKKHPVTPSRIAGSSGMRVGTMRKHIQGLSS